MNPPVSSFACGAAALFLGWGWFDCYMKQRWYQNGLGESEEYARKIRGIMCKDCRHKLAEWQESQLDR